MKNTPQDQKMFQSLNGSELGKWLVDYARRLQDYAHDSRSWEEGDSKESSAQAARLIEKCFVEKIRPKTEGKHIVESEFE